MTRMEQNALRVMREALDEDLHLAEGIISAPIGAVRRSQLRKHIKQVPKDFATIKRELQGLPWDKAAAKVRYYVNKFYPGASKEKKAALVKQAVGKNPKAKRK